MHQDRVPGLPSQPRVRAIELIETGKVAANHCFQHSADERLVRSASGVTS